MENNFNNYSLSEELMKAIELLNYKKPTEVQNSTIPAILDRKDVIIKSKTGSGKTAAFAIPVCELVDWYENEVQALVLTPTRELAMQVNEDVFNIGRFKRIRSVGLHGGESFARQSKELRQKTHIAVGTPGRVLDHIKTGTLDTSNIKILVIDEADEMLNMGFIDEMEAILATISKDRITVLASATMGTKIDQMIKKNMKDPIKVEIDEEEVAVNNISYQFYKAKEDSKEKLLRDVAIVENPDSCIIFCNTKIAVDTVDRFLYDNGFNCKKIHGGMEQRDRTQIMNMFKRNEFRYLIATDVAARGIDVDEISLIINYDIPKKQESFIHRIGRTGRNGKKGKAITFVSETGKLSYELLKENLGFDQNLLEGPNRSNVEKARKAFDLKLQMKPKYKAEKGTKLAEDIMKIHINAGRKTKMRAVDIVGTLCSIEGMTASDIGIINIIDISTFVEILNGKGESVLRALQTKSIKGRPRVVSKVEIEKN